MRALIITLIAIITTAFFSANERGSEGGTPKTAGLIDLSDLPDYAGQFIPAYITRDNTPSNNPITNEAATLGRVLFHDKQLSLNGSLSCSGCHQQQFAFSDTALASVGIAGTTGRHSMRLVNARFGEEVKFFWDERAASLEIQTTMPVQDHVEMGFSGLEGDPAIDSLIARLATIDYYPPLFAAAFGDAGITEERMQRALAQFIRSIQSFDSRFDEGRALVANIGQPFPNYTQQENMGKQLFLAPPVFNAQGFRTGGGAGCQGCHRGPEFDIDPASLNNGFFGSINGGADLTNTRAPSLRDVVGPGGTSNGPFFHHGGITGLNGVIAHYDSMPGAVLDQNPQIDPRLTPGGQVQRLSLTQQERVALVAFLGTLTGVALYTDEKWSDPFLDGGLTVINGPIGIAEQLGPTDLILYPNPASDRLFLKVSPEWDRAELVIHDGGGKVVHQGFVTSTLDISSLIPGTYLLRIGGHTQRFVKF